MNYHELVAFIGLAGVAVAAIIWVMGDDLDD